MKQYKVKALSVGGSNNRIFKSGDIVTSDCFPEGNTTKLVEQGFLTELDSEENKMTKEQKAEAKKAEKLAKEEAEKGTDLDLGITSEEL